ncbi:uncharacterized protein BO80DRAFT_76258 [Aspergillus ibericus CBS 121593]|uniref:Uncharacterized protein n=1 Tax=Aspergillus ibericus CBS 121593 TaxID=1448316 RepID=A0A395HCV0_9EURO|nr:hypothetical protein BO80DRAFT_76258 [Aspergillus ibericus CBS 121593]RAL05642.1 hypothetical protein BO80DRAFT_76258 [Aspergillus ibericus CBS 121593]
MLIKNPEYCPCSTGYLVDGQRERETQSLFDLQPPARLGEVQQGCSGVTTASEQTRRQGDRSQAAESSPLIPAWVPQPSSWVSPALPKTNFPPNPPTQLTSSDQRPNSSGHTQAPTT